MKARTAAALAVLAAAACTRQASGPPPSSTATAPANTQTAATPTTSGLKPGPHSPLADVDLPAGATFAGSSSLEERWNYGTSYAATAAFLSKQFASGRKYDARGATWWRALPPCYNGTHHESPPEGWVTDDSTRWVWADANTSLSVQIFRPSSTVTPSEIVIDYMRPDDSYVCNRQ
jgi:hypothetical protein